MKESLLFLSLVFAAFTLEAYAQKWGCQEKDFKCQLAALTKAIQANPKDAENYYNIGTVFQNSGAHKEAVESFSMYVAIPGLKPELQADGYNNRGISQRALKRFDQAMEDYTTAIELHPKPEFFVNRGNVAVDMYETSQAVADYGRAIKLDPKYSRAYAQRGILYVNLKDHVEALNDLTKAIELEPAYAEPYYNRGTIYFQRKEWAKAIPDLDRYIGLVKDPAYLADGYMNRGISHYYTGSKPKAVEDFSKVIELQPKQTKAYKARAMVYRELKKDDLAAADERKAAELAGSKQ